MKKSFGRFLVIVPIITSVVAFILGKMGASQIYLSDFSVGQLFNIFTVSALFLLTIRGITWFILFRKFDISSVYPFMSVSYVIMLFVSHILFGESFTANKLVGSILIMFGAFFVNMGNKPGFKCDD